MVSTQDIIDAEFRVKSARKWIIRFSILLIVLTSIMTIILGLPTMQIASPVIIIASCFALVESAEATRSSIAYAYIASIIFTTQFFAVMIGSILAAFIGRAFSGDNMGFVQTYLIVFLVVFSVLVVIGIAAMVATRKFHKAVHAYKRVTRLVNEYA